MIIITSAALISAELQAELGKMPPIMLPLANKRLYDYQITSIRQTFDNIDVYISLPDGFELPVYDEIQLKKLRVNIIRVPDGLELGASLLYAINSISRYDQGLKILHGDTYIRNLPIENDIVSLSKSFDSYSWEFESTSDISGEIWCGFFALSDTKFFVKNLSDARGNFVKAIKLYQANRKLQFPLIDDWYDLGHVNTYFRSRAHITAERNFNELTYSKGLIRKKSDQSSKIIAECSWYQNIPASLKIHVPQLIRHGEIDSAAFYEIEYFPYLPLNELYVFGNLPKLFWKKIINLSFDLLFSFTQALDIDDEQRRVIEIEFCALIVEKTWERLKNYISETSDDLDNTTQINTKVLPSIRDIVNHCQEETIKLPKLPSFAHGDFCFSNILYDPRTDLIKMIDPRGANVRLQPTNLGDLRYDIAKYLHSVLGLYDHIVAGKFVLREHEPLRFEFSIESDSRVIEIIQDVSKQIIFNTFPVKNFLPMVVLLFISMLPLHSDNKARQRAFLANALRIYAIWQEL